jgi:hypothetical protein
MTSNMVLTCISPILTQPSLRLHTIFYYGNNGPLTCVLPTTTTGPRKTQMVVLIKVDELFWEDEQHLGTSNMV